MMAMMLQSESSSRSLSSRAPAATADSERASEHPLLQEESVSNPPELTVAAGLPSAGVCPDFVAAASKLPGDCWALNFAIFSAAHSTQRQADLSWPEKFHSLPGSVRVGSLRTRGQHSGSRAIRSRSHRKPVRAVIPIEFSSAPPQIGIHPVPGRARAQALEDESTADCERQLTVPGGGF
jgi:hypothetical protein